jgi:DNA-binding GntR family transcriptional regulator
MPKAEKLEEAVTQLREQILRGEFGVRGSLPPRAILEKELGIPHSTMSQVILRLQGEGLIAYSGNRRLQAIPQRKRVPSRSVAFTRFLQAQGLEPVTEYLERPERLPMDEDLAKAFGVAPGTLYVARIRRDGTKQMWYRVTSKYYLSSLIDDRTLTGMKTNDKYDAIMDIKNNMGITAQFMSEDIIARLPSSHEQDVLGIARYVPLQEITRTSYNKSPDEGGKVLWLNKILLVAPLFVTHYEYIGEALWNDAG